MSLSRGPAKDLIVRPLTVEGRDVLYVKCIVQANEGLGSVHTADDGTLLILAPRGREAELDGLIQDLLQELGLEIPRDE